MFTMFTMRFNCCRKTFELISFNISQLEESNRSFSEITYLSKHNFPEYNHCKCTF